jgi:hypothetical protein
VLAHVVRERLRDRAAVEDVRPVFGDAAQCLGKIALDDAIGDRPSAASATAGSITASRGSAPKCAWARHSPATTPGTPTARWPTWLSSPFTAGQPYWPGDPPSGSSAYMSARAASGARRPKSTITGRPA